MDYRNNMSIIGLVTEGGHQDIVAIGSYADEGDKKAEIAFVVRENFQGLGVASYLLGMLEKIARENEFTGFTAYVLRKNPGMLHVFKKHYPNLKIKMNGGSDLALFMEFDNALDSNVG